MTAIEELNQEIAVSAKGIGAIARIEQLRRLIRHRRFSNDEMTLIRLKAERDKYIETAVLLAKRAQYSKKRAIRLAHEVNRSFDPYFTPDIVHEIAEKTFESDTSEIDIDAHMVDLGVTKEEYIVMLGSNAS